MVNYQTIYNLLHFLFRRFSYNYFLFILLFYVRTYLYTLLLNIHQKSRRLGALVTAPETSFGIKLRNHTEGIQSPLALPHIQNTSQTHSIYLPLLSLSSEILTF
jgi:hypothetical protein